jgi:hypothetical protein
LQTVTPGDHSPGVRQWVHSRTIHVVGGKVSGGRLSID